MSKRPTKEDIITTLKVTQDNLDDYRDKWLRAEAELENHKKRFLNELQINEYKTVGLVLMAILPTWDSFTQALKQNITEHERDNLNMLKAQLISNLSLISVKVCSYDKFNPLCHMVINTVNDETKPDGSIIEVYQDGFLHKDRVIRNAQVSVNKL